MIYISDCTFCVHNKGVKIDGWKSACDAFPEGIPFDFFKKKASELPECNNGIGYEPRK